MEHDTLFDEKIAGAESLQGKAGRVWAGEPAIVRLARSALCSGSTKKQNKIVYHSWKLSHIRRLLRRLPHFSWAGLGRTCSHVHVHMHKMLKIPSAGTAQEPVPLLVPPPTPPLLLAFSPSLRR